MLRSESDQVAASTTSCGGSLLLRPKLLLKVRVGLLEPEPRHLARVGLVRLHHVDERIEDLLSPPVRVGPPYVVERAPEQLGQPPQSGGPVVALVAVLWHGLRLRAR